MNPHDVAAELRARAEEARVEAAREKTPLSDYFYGVRDGLDEAASLVESSQEAPAARSIRDPWCDDLAAVREDARVDPMAAHNRAAAFASTRVREDDEARVDADEDSIERARIGIEQGMKRIQEGDTDEALNELWFARICLGDPDCRLIREPAPPTLKGEDDDEAG